jgi:hypothetical protein
VRIGETLLVSSSSLRSCASWAAAAADSAADHSDADVPSAADHAADRLFQLVVIGFT